MNPAQQLIDFKKEKSYMIGIDSDGCAFDSMEFKHKECFAVCFIHEWELQKISKYARETWDFVNLYSEWRGANRFPALVKVIELLTERQEVVKRNFKLSDIESLKNWIDSGATLSNPFLEKELEKTKDPILAKALNWSKAVNESIKKMARGLAPFPYVRESMEKAYKTADIIVVSATPIADIKREWEEHDIEKYTKVIAGQEMGVKKEHLRLAREGRYPSENVLMIGDALGDYKAAKDNNVLFYPINPGYEEESWKRFYEESLDRFINGTYKGAYQEKLINEFRKFLPSSPPWRK